MADLTSKSPISISRLIFVPSVITLAVTLLRLMGELRNWSPLLFGKEAGGGGAVVGIAWLPFIFGPYFAVKLIKAGEGPASVGKALGWTLLGLVALVVAAVVGFAHFADFPGKMVLGYILTGAALLFFNPGWPKLFKTLLAYAYAARIPVAFVMLLAIYGEWGTHYDAPPPNYVGPTDPLGKFFVIGFLPQMILWVGYTVFVGSLFGVITAGIAGRQKAQPASV